MISVALIGVGRWGPNLLRNFISMEGVSVEMICDADNNRLVAVKKRFPAIASRAKMPTWPTPCTMNC